jgi:hypothetical protein
MSILVWRKGDQRIRITFYGPVINPPKRPKNVTWPSRVREPARQTKQQAKRRTATGWGTLSSAFETNRRRH